MKKQLTTEPLACSRCGRTDWIFGIVIDTNPQTATCVNCLDQNVSSDPPVYHAPTTNEGTSAQD